MKTITLKCILCQKEFEREIKQYNKWNKNNPNIFCSVSHAVTYRNLNQPKDYWKQQYEKRKDVFDIKNYSGNMWDEYSPFKYFITKCKERKKHKGFNYDIDLKYLKELWEKQKGICPYTNIKMILPNSTASHQEEKTLKKASLDRIDSSLGYVKGNVEFVCLFMNFAKNGYKKEEVKEFINELKFGDSTRT